MLLIGVVILQAAIGLIAFAMFCYAVGWLLSFIFWFAWMPRKKPRR